MNVQPSRGKEDSDKYFKVEDKLVKPIICLNLKQSVRSSCCLQTSRKLDFPKYYPPKLFILKIITMDSDDGHSSFPEF
jgi:hypothetical protein